VDEPKGAKPAIGMVYAELGLVEKAKISSCTLSGAIRSKVQGVFVGINGDADMAEKGIIAKEVGIGPRLAHIRNWDEEGNLHCKASPIGCQEYNPSSHQVPITEYATYSVCFEGIILRWGEPPALGNLWVKYTPCSPVSTII
jgi:hypothetical protein